jgi:translation initiation factor 3 subunit M
MPSAVLKIHVVSKSLSNLFNTLPRPSALRLLVYKVLLELASSNDELQVLQVSRAGVEKWLKEWDITPAEKSAFLKTLVDAFAKAGEQYVRPRFFITHRWTL